MTCSSNTISTPERRRRLWLVAVALLGAVLAGPGVAAAPGQDFIVKAREALAQGEG